LAPHLIESNRRRTIARRMPRAYAGFARLRVIAAGGYPIERLRMLTVLMR
jgi:hypothetical protein